MADNVELNIGAGGKTIATDDIGGIQHELVKVEFGTDGNATMVSPANPLPVTDNATEVSVASIDLKTPALGQALAAASTPVVIASDQSGIPITALTLPLPTDAATAANQTLEIELLTTIDAGLPVSLGQTTMAGSMPVVIASDQSPLPVTFSGGAIDNTQLYSNTISATGAITGINTTGYASIIIQLSGAWAAQIVFEGSHDNSTWDELLVMNVNELSMIDVISTNGIFAFKTTSKFIRLNVLGLQTGTITALILGRTVIGINGADVLSLAMDKGNNSPLYTQDITGSPLKDANNAAIPSDAPKPIILTFAQTTNVASPIIDTQGYQSLSVQVAGITGTSGFQMSNDGITWTSVVGHPISTNLADNSTILTNGIVYIIPTYGRYFRILVTVGVGGAITCTCYLRQQPYTNQTQNIAFINGTAPVTGGVAGILAVGGNISVGIAPTSNPIPLAIDTSGLTRRLLTDTGGRIITNINTASTDQSGTARGLGSLSPASTVYNIASLATQDVTQFEGQSQIEILAQMLLEMRIMNQYLSELPTVLQGQNGKFDEPLQFRNDPTVFAN